MQWNKKDVIQYQDAAEYIDTLLIPLMPITLHKDRSKYAFQADIIHIFAQEIERAYKGRIFLLPHFTYILTSNKEQETIRLNEWVNHCKENPFKHVFFLTFDTSWKKHESNLDGTLLWFPTIQTGDLSSEESKKVIQDQITQVTELIQSYW